MSTLLERPAALQSRHIVGMRVDGTSYADAAARVIDWAKSGDSRYVCVASVNNVMHARDTPDYRNIMNAADPVPGGPNQIAPGKSRITGICPTLVFDQDRPVLALGAPGGTRIITGVLQVVLNVLDHGLSPQEAVSAPRFDCQSEVLDAEASIPRFRLDELGKRGFQIAQRAAPYGPHTSFGLVQAIAFDASTGAMRGGGDPRGDSVVFSD
jgi:gamma-glutamyltranspeptidase